MNRITSWRHRTGRSRNRYPKGSVNYRAVALGIARKHFPHLRESHMEDLFQECEILRIEAEARRIHVQVGERRRAFGNCRDRIGIKCFSRAVYARLHEMSKRYGYFRPKSSKAYYTRKAWDWGLKDEWVHSCPSFESPESVFGELKGNVPAEILEKALGGDANATALIRAIIWDE